jgi:hypothetical protein
MQKKFLKIFATICSREFTLCKYQLLNYNQEFIAKLFYPQ